MRIQVYSPGIPHTGYGRMGFAIIDALERNGAEIRLVNDYAAKIPDPAPNVLFMCPPQRPAGWYDGQRVSILTMWESSELAFEHLTTVPVFDQVFVPSKQNLELFGAVNDNTHLISLGCDYGVWNPTPRKPQRPFTVFTGGKGAHRKGFDITLKVFRRFSDRVQAQGHPAPRLIIRGAANLSKRYEDVHVMDDYISDEEEATLFEEAHVYMGLSRGEGWGMIPHQTIAQGIPTILTDAHGHAEFSHYGIGVPWHETTSLTDVVGRSGYWWEADEDAAYEALCNVYDNYEIECRKAMLNAEMIREDLTWDKTAKQILSHMSNEKFFSPGEWQYCPQYLLRVKVTQALDCFIGGTEHSFRPGKEYEVTADVKRVLYDANCLDPSCIDAQERAIYKKLGTIDVVPGTAILDEGQLVA